jgi:ABC-2 type transport system permease protein
MYFLIKYLLRKWRERQARKAGELGSDSGSEPPAGPTRVTHTDDSGPPAAARGPAALLAHQVRFDLRTSLRNPRARFATFLFPIIILVVFNGVFGHGHTVVDGVTVKMSKFYVPGIIAMSVVVAAYAGLVVSLATLRESGVLKRRRATPVPAAFLIAGQALSTVVVTAAMATLLLVIAKVLYGVGFSAGALAAIGCTVLVGTASFASIAYAVSGLIGSPEAAQPVVQATMFPLWFISGVFIPTDNLSGALHQIAELFPVEHVANSLHLASVHSSFASAISVTDLLVLAAWGVAAAAFCAWRFSWLPSTATA